MGSNDIAVRFTEGYYATKKEVSKELKISVIDGVWDKILSYRAPFCHYLSIPSILLLETQDMAQGAQVES